MYTYTVNRGRIYTVIRGRIYTVMKGRIHTVIRGRIYTHYTVISNNLFGGCNII